MCLPSVFLLERSSSHFVNNGARRQVFTSDRPLDSSELLLRRNAAILRCMDHPFVTLQARGVLSLPADVRRRHGLDRPGAQVEVVEREDGILLRPHVPVPADQAWFWTDRWQRMER